jgi:regulator of protease activity HflC (stomatin/prohibitin superfamily)
MSPKTIIKTVTIAVLAILAFIIQPFTYENIDAGNVGIKLNLYGTDKGVDKITLVSGRVWFNTWTTRVIEFPTYVQNVDYKPFAINTVDAAKFEIDTKMQYRVLSDSVPKIYTTFRTPLSELQDEGRYIQTAVYDAFKAIVPKYTSDSLMAKRAQFEGEVEGVLKERLGSRGIVLEQLTSNIAPPQSMADAIEQKNSSIQARLAAENLAKQAIAEASVIKAKAEGEAAATLVRARAEAEANKLRQNSLTPLLIQQQWINRWSGDLPQYITGAQSTFMMGLPKQ